MHKEIKVGKKGNRWFHYGYSHRRFAIGVAVSRRSFDLDLFFVWIGLEW